MAKQKSDTKGYRILAGILIFLCINLYCVAAVLSPNTLIKWWIPLVFAAVISLFTGLIMWRIWRKVTFSGKKWINYICHAIFMTGLLTAVFYICNFTLTDHSSLRTEKAVVENKYYKVRHKSKRISRRVYGRGEAYNVGYMDIRFPNGHSTSLQINQKKFNRISVGDTLSFDIVDGLFGIPVIKNIEPRDVPHYRRPTPQNPFR